MGATVETVRVLAVDDHPRFLAAARAVVEATPGFSWAGGASSGPEALRAAARERPDLVLADVNMPEMDGFELARELGDTHPATLVALVSAKDPDELPRQPAGTPQREVSRKESLRPAWLRALWEQHRGPPPSGK